MYKEFSIGTFNVRGLTKEEKQEALARDVDSYRVDVCCLQETKIEKGLDYSIGDQKHKLVALDTNCRFYGSGFVVSSKWKNNIHRHWKVSDRVSVLQLATNAPEYECIPTEGINLRIQPKKVFASKKIIDTKLKIKVAKVKNCISIINVYAPTTERVKDDPTELDQLYLDIGNTISKLKNDETSRTSLLLIAGDFNAKVGKSKGELCLGSYSRGKRNTSGQMLVDFCNTHNLFICNSSFKHPARHMTTWEQTRINKETNKTIKVYNQIDYILCEKSQKNTLLNARSYSGTEVNSDHRLVITRLRIAKYHLHKVRKQKVSRPINTPRLQEPEICEQYKQKMKENMTNIKNSQFTNIQEKWDTAVNMITKTGEEILGFKPSVNNNHNRSHEEIDQMSKEQKKLRLLISSCQDTDTIIRLRTERNRLLKEIRKKVKTNREKEIDDKVSDINNLQDESKMFKAVKMLKRNKFENPFVYDKDRKHVTNPKEIYKIVKNHFHEHFYDVNIKEVEAFVGEPKKLTKPITDDDVTKAVKKLNNNRAAGSDGISAELVKFAPKEVHTFIQEVLNDVIENHQHLDLGRGILVALQKPGKEKGPVKNLRPVILLLIIRKILSNILLERIKPQYESYLSHSQSAYRANRSTGDIVWAHRWITAKAQTKQIKVLITGLDMSSAFDTIIREDLIKILENILEEDEVRMVRLLLSNTTLDIKMNGIETEKFASNIGSPQGDGISGVLFNIYLEECLRRMRTEVNKCKIEVEHSYCRVEKSSLPDEEIYADDTDFISNDVEKKELVLKVAEKVFPERNLIINQDKTEHTILERGNRNTESWRNVKKVGSLIGDAEDIIRRKQLAIASMNDLKKIWIRKDRISENRRLKLYRALVKPVLTYNCGTWGLTKKDEEKLDSFHRKQLKILIGKKYPNIISNSNLYKRCNEYPLSLFVLKSRWKLFGHILRSDVQCPANKAMFFYFEKTNSPGFRGRPRTTIVTTINNDIQRTLNKVESCPLRSLKSLEDLEHTRKLALDRSVWRSLIRDIYKVAEDERPH